MKKVCGTFLCMSIAFNCLMADDASDLKALEIRKAQAILKNKARKVESVKDEISNLNDDLVNSAVVDENTLKTSGSANTMMDSVSSVRLKKTNEDLLKAGISKGEDRKTATKSAQKEIGEAISELSQIKKLAALKADKAKLSAKLAEAVTDLKNVGEKLKEEVKKELAGEKLNQEKINELADKQEKIADELKELTQDVKEAAKNAENPEDKKELEKVAAALEGEKKPEDKNAQKPEDKAAQKPENKANEPKPESAEKKAEEIAKNIENKELTEALKKEKDLVEKLDKAAKELANNAEKNDEPLTKEEQAEKDVEELAEALDKQNEDLENLKEEHEGDENLQQDKEFNEKLEQQNKLKKAAKNAKEKLANEPKAKADLDKAEKALDEAKKQLEEGDIKEAMEKNDEAEKDIKEALDKLEKDSKSAKDKKKKEKGKKGKKGEEEEKDKKEGKPEKEDPEMAEVKLDFDEDQKAKEGDRDTETVKMRDNKEQLGDMPTAEAVWGNRAGEKDKKVLMQSLRDKAPKEYDDLTRKYFEALASIGE